MTEPQSDAKILKKSIKAQAKLAKKGAKAAQATDTAAAPQNSWQITPAERSAAAAEKQVRLQRWRVILALAGVAIGIATILLTMRPWDNSTTGVGDDQLNQSATRAAPTP